MTGREVHGRRRAWSRRTACSGNGCARLPGVTAAGGISSLPLSQMMAWGPITVEGRVPPAGEKFINADMRMVERRLLPRDGDSAPARTAVHRARSCGQSPRGRHRLVHGRSALARSGPDRQAPAHRRRRLHDSLDHRRRRRRPHQAGRARFGSAHRDVLSPPAVPDARAERRLAQPVGSRGAECCCPRTDSRPRSRATGLRNADDERTCRPVAGAPAFLDAAARAFRRAGAGPCVHRRLRGDGVPGQPGHERDWNPDRPWRDAGGDPDTRHASGAGRGRRGRRHRPGCGLRRSHA